MQQIQQRMNLKMKITIINKLKMMKILITIVLLICTSSIYALSAKEQEMSTDKRMSLNIEKIDSVIIRTLEWHVTTFGYLGFNRKAFDKTYNYVLDNTTIRKNTLIYYIKIENELSLSLLIAMLNNLQPSIEQEPTHDEIMAKSEDFTIDNYVMIGYARNDDPIEVRGQIKIYFKDHSVKIGYMSPTLLDYDNTRYLSAPLSSFINNYCYKLDKGLVK